MDLSCIISSGDLELYVLGMLTEEEAYKIEQLALLFPEVEAEITRIRETVHTFSDEAEVHPGPHVRENFIKAIRELKEQDNGTTDIVPEAATISNQEEEPVKVVSMYEQKSNKQGLLAASVIGLIISLGGVFYLFTKSNQYKQQLLAVESRLNTLQQSNQQQQEQLAAYNKTMEMLHDPVYKKVELTKVPGKPDALVQLFWNTRSREVFISNVSLPAAPKGKQYQLWAIVNGKPVDAGMVAGSKNVAQQMKTFEQAEAFAITMEKEGGSPTPTMEAMYLMAKI